MSTKYIFVVGGVMSGIGKGVATSSIGKILQSRGWKVSAMKIDPYINVDAGTMNPIEHGEVFVTEDGLECDQDIGNYERFFGVPMHRVNYMTTGAVYQTVINKERNLQYGGKCVEVVPHIPEEIIRRIKTAARHDKADILMVEIGGTVGEYQNMLFLEAARMMHLRTPHDVLFVMVSYLPVPEKIGEMKTKPTQYAVRTLNSAGIQPDLIIARGETPIDKPRKQKISVFCNLSDQDIISAPDITTIYEVPLNFEKDKLGDRIQDKLKLKRRKKDLHDWGKLIRSIKRSRKQVRIGIVGKYFATGNFSLTDSYISVLEALKHASWAERHIPELVWLNAELYEKNRKILKNLQDFDGIVVPGGFGKRGSEGKINVIEYCRKERIPILGLCYGMQLMVVEFARHIAKMKNAHSIESDSKTPYPVIDVMAEQKSNIKEKHLGGTMRLGSYSCKVIKGTVAEKAYQKTMVQERHRHRYEVNNKHIDRLQRKGLVVSGINPERKLVEIIEITDHPFFLGTQFHPEFTSLPLQPHPIFLAFLKSIIKKRRNAS
ncbi:MAG: CTP synthase [Candidatus Ryanbacteria bacterium RIFCSPHIGHO2_02_FULL_45_43]|uniref:CTP synthase n=1 Tax=Candidatus Ryanbacteria bacterium RIFCSPHIGHO2_01_45_13 TaxID=1802112 RepID=A0A1G2FYM5_9BACT|nr:MAG: CTP synthase [Candidatus Ryanbacteria bacterium RIFCSPHIGHO2_01_FULL_44_130]OGZ42947.1 MAG: CTP synthase [Candidatus Ryanbacteria bacterium RIFCSPHIGHO2_01_45_13]OGZ48652.1 MAG: CTP synthase [Candidatus Ryanbacteria bacterium RIFCSPHIGHO2_02_FULL_45_43]OGZ50592.1 MAG: CTP synthase [Candidatus Ryanbacteria bacterium RIFCSPHIGHO2_12_FULL_44_20]OGZ51898.1 MAG: CTP synthase [Candidatus Ryanbacteria bacterium RIFCSPLOWO2_01_FULL_44_230]OGZ53878.1 MAG: CTP synthase [Candidatus Ryanbacteria b